jgi:hypothetical protein
MVMNVAHSPPPENTAVSLLFPFILRSAPKKQKSGPTVQPAEMQDPNTLAPYA